MEKIIFHIKRSCGDFMEKIIFPKIKNPPSHYELHLKCFLARQILMKKWIIIG